MLLDILTEEEKALFAGICRITEYEPDQLVVAEGSEGGTILIVRRGKAEARKRLDEQGKYKLLKQMGAGDFFGETTFLCGCPRSADIVTIEKTEMLEVAMKEFDEFCKEYPDAGVKIYRVMAQEVAERLKQNNEDLKKAVKWASQEG
jgi:CRP-like cAMP-binding protein